MSTRTQLRQSYSAVRVTVFQLLYLQQMQSDISSLILYCGQIQTNFGLIQALVKCSVLTPLDGILEWNNYGDWIMPPEFPVFYLPYCSPSSLLPANSSTWYRSLLDRHPRSSTLGIKVILASEVLPVLARHQESSSSSGDLTS